MRRWRSIVRIGLLVGLLGAVLLAGVYLYATRPSYVRAQFLAALAQRGLTARSLGAARFNMLTGIEFEQLELLLPEVPGAVTPDQPKTAPAVWTIGSGRLGLPLSDLLQGRRTPREVIVDRVQLGVIRPTLDFEDGEGPAWWEVLSDMRDFPRIVARDAELYLYEPGPQRMLRRRMRLDINAERKDGALHATIRQTGGSVGSNQGEAIPGLDVNLRESTLSGRIDDLDLDLLEPLLPDEVRAEFARLGVHGRIACPRWSLDLKQGAFEVEVGLRDAGVTVPIEPGDFAGERFARFDETQFTVRASGADLTRVDTLEGEWDARLRGAPVRGRFSVREIPLDGRSFDPLSLPHHLTVAIEQLQLPSEHDFPAFVHSPDLHIEARSILQKYSPVGAVNFNLTFQRSGPDAAPEYSGVLEALGPAAQYVQFPYPVVDTRGTVTFSRSGIDLDLRCTHGSAGITVVGHVNNSSPWTGFTLTVRGRGVPLDQELYAALPENYQELWTRAAPLGMADIDARIDRDDGTPSTGPLDERVEVDARLIGGSISFDDQRITHANAVMRIREGEIAIDDFHGYLGGAGITCHGSLQADQTKNADYVRLRAAGMAIDEDASKTAQPFTYEGHGDVWGSVAGSEPDTYIARLRDGALRGMIADEGWDVQRGWVQRRGDTQQVLGLEAQRGARWLKIDGDLGADSGPAGNIALQAGDPRIDNLLKHLVPTEWDNARQLLGLSGEGTLRLNLNELHPEQTEAEVWLTAEAMQPRPIPLPLRGVSAHARLRTDGFTLYDATATCSSDGQLRVTGEGRWSDTERWTRIGIRAEGIDLDQSFVAAMPDPLGSMLRELDIQGQLRTVARHLQLAQMQDGTWNASGRLGFRSANLQVGLKLDSFDGEIDGEVTVPPGGDFRADAQFAIERGTLAGRPVTNLRGRLLRQPGMNRLRIDDLQGNVCGGAVSGTLEVDPASGQYEVSLTLRDVRAAELFEPSAESGLPGVLEGRVFLRGNRNDPTSRVGGGTLRVREAPVTASAITAELAAAAKRETKPLGDLIKQAEIRFAWEGDMVRLQRVELQTPRLRLVGNGAWNTRSDALRLTMVGSTPEGLRLAIISDLVDAAGQELLQYRINGTTEDPKVQVRPLHTITDPIRNLLRGR